MSAKDRLLRKTEKKTDSNQSQTNHKNKPDSEKKQPNKKRFAGVKPIGKSVALEANEKIDELLETLKFKSKQASFIKEFVIDFKPEEAAERAGYGDRKYGYNLLRRPEVNQAIEAILSAHEENALITPEFLQGQMGIYSKSNMADYFSDEGFVGWSNLTRKQTSCIKMFHKKFDKEGRPDIKLSLYDADRANENLARSKGLYSESKEDPKEFDGLSQDELIDWLGENLPVGILEEMLRRAKNES